MGLRVQSARVDMHNRDQASDPLSVLQLPVPAPICADDPVDGVTVLKRLNEPHNVVSPRQRPLQFDGGGDLPPLRSQRYIPGAALVDAFAVLSDILPAGQVCVGADEAGLGSCRVGGGGRGADQKRGDSEGG